jgi:hypothetical protein
MVVTVGVAGVGAGVGVGDEWTDSSDGAADAAAVSWIT